MDQRWKKNILSLAKCCIYQSSLFKSPSSAAHLDDPQFQIFNELRGKLQDILRAVKALVAARKKGWAMASNADEMDAEWFLWDYVASTNWLSESKFTIFEANLNKIAVFWGLISQSEQISIFWRPDGPSEQNLTVSVQACCDPNILGEIFEILSVHNTQIFENFHLALPPIIRGPCYTRLFFACM